MKLNEAIAVNESITKLMEKDIPISLAFKLERILRVLNPDVTDFFQKRKTLIEKNSTLTEDKSNYTMTPDQQKLINEEIESMTQINIDFPEDLKLDEKVFEKVETSVTGTIIFGLRPILTKET